MSSGEAMSPNGGADYRRVMKDRPLEPVTVEQVAQRDNVLNAWKQVKANKGAPGIDNISIEEFQVYAHENWRGIKTSLLDGTYRPHPVKRVEIPKDNGGTRNLGIPVVVDRVIQQAISRVARYPKFVGILHTYDHNLHPGLLLLAATLYTPREDETLSVEQFYSLTDFFAEDYADFILNKYPPLTGRLQEEQARRIAVRKLYSELSNAIALLFIPRSLSPYSSLTPNVTLYEKWMSYFARKINIKLKTFKNKDIEQPNRGDRE